MRNWFKLVGVTNGPVPDNWTEVESDLFEVMRFPKHRPPRNISNHERLIGYAVEKGKVFLVQTRAGGIRIQPPYGPKEA